MNRLTRRRFLQGCLGAAAVAALPGAAFAENSEALPPLRQMALRAGIEYGAAVGSPHLKQDPAFAAAVARECGVIVGEYETKWSFIRARRDEWNFSGTDALWDFAGRHDQSLRGHTLIWHNALPNWVKDDLNAATAQQLMEAHINTVVTRYLDAIATWDVVNEAIYPSDHLENGYRQSPWLVMGADYIEKAFRLAHAANDNATLIYNDYGVEFDARKADKILSLLRRLKDSDTPIHGVGLQCHSGNGEKLDLRGLNRFCRGVADMGLELQITELDIKDTRLPDDETERDMLVAERTRAVLETIFAVQKPTQLLTWGLSDQYTWLLDKKMNPSGRPVRPLPLDRTMRRKPMWLAIHDVLRQAA